MRIAVVGCGKVGTTLALILSMQGYVRELVLCGRSRESVLGEALDLLHAQSLAPVPTSIIAGNPSDTAGSDILVICASIPMPREMTDRAILAQGNVALMRDLLPRLAALSPGAKLVMVSNPVDVLTWHACELTGFEPKRVMGTGTLIDSARFRQLLSEEVEIHPNDLRVYVLGEHGATQFPGMASATAAGEPIEDTPKRRELFAQTVRAGFEVFRLKGYTNFGVAMAAATIIESIALDERHTLPVSLRVDGFCGVSDVCLSLPAVIGAGGIERILHPVLNEEERMAFLRSAEAVRRQIAGCAG